jgi:hypothetical protein
VTLAVVLLRVTGDLDEYLPKLIEALAVLVDLVPVELRRYLKEHLE